MSVRRSWTDRLGGRFGILIMIAGLLIIAALIMRFFFDLDDERRLSAVEDDVESPGVAAAASLPGTGGALVWSELVEAADADRECVEWVPVFDSSEIACLPLGTGASQRDAARVMLLASGFPEESLDQAVSDDLAVMVRDADVFHHASLLCLTGTSASELPILSCEQRFAQSEVVVDEDA